MPRPLRIEYGGARYHLLSRGDRGEDIVLDDDNRKRRPANGLLGLPVLSPLPAKVKNTLTRSDLSTVLPCQRKSI